MELLDHQTKTYEGGPAKVKVTEYRGLLLLPHPFK
jgi:hypothetical protein